MDCVQPPIQDPPEGEWHCPECPPVLPDNIPYLPTYQNAEDVPPPPLSPTVLQREPSVASTSRSVIPAQPTSTKPKRIRKSTAKVKARLNALAAEESEHDVPQPETPMAPRPRGRPPKGTIRPKPRAPTASSEAEPDEHIRTPRRKRPRESSPPPTTLSARMVRLRIPPQKGKGKEREEEELSPHGLFDDFLGVEDRDTSKTTPSNTDKLLFERSRILAEVRRYCSTLSFNCA